MKKKILIVGMNSLIGTHLSLTADREKLDVIGTSRHISSNSLSLDFLNDKQIESLPGCDTAYLCASEGSILKCLQQPLLTRHVNVEQTIKVATHLHKLGSNIVFLSSNLVFDCNYPYIGYNEKYSPLTEYGKQKAEAETILINSLQNVAIVRMTKIVHPQFALFLEWFHSLKQGCAIKPFSDMSFSPLNISYVANELLGMAYAFRPGVFQLSADVDIYYSQAAEIFAKCCGFESSLVMPQTTSDVGFSQYFPRFATLQHHPFYPGYPESALDTLNKVFKSLCNSI